MINIVKKAANPPKYFPKLGKLPTKPSQLIRIAIDDLVKAEKKFSIDMSQWVAATDKNKKCVVCFAGSVMTGTLKCKLPSLSNSPDEYGYSALSPDDFPESEALYALNAFREGKIEDAFSYLGINFPDNFENYIKVVDYHRNKALFKKQMRELANALEKEGY